MIYGIGTDIVAVDRLRDALSRHGERYVERILAPGERAAFAKASDGARFLAKRFAVKEAFSKAFGTGLRGDVNLQTIAITHDALGRPVFTFAPELAALMQAQGLSAQVSISDEKDYVVAFVVIEQKG